MTTSRPVKCELVNPTIDDALYVARRIPQDEIAQVEALSGATFDADNTALWFWNTQFKIACRDDQETIAVCGFSPIGPGVYRTFFLATEYAWQNHGRELTELTIIGMKKIVASEKIRRLETLCLASRKAAQLWYRRLGLEFESTLRGFAANGEDAVMFTKLEKK